MKTKKSNLFFPKFNIKIIILILLQLIVIFIFAFSLKFRNFNKSNFDVKILISQYTHILSQNNVINDHFFFGYPNKINLYFKHYSKEYFGNIFNMENSKKKMIKYGCNSNLSDFDIYIANNFFTENTFQDLIELKLSNSTSENVISCVDSIKIIFKADLLNTIELLLQNQNKQLAFFKEKKKLLSKTIDNNNFFLNLIFSYYNERIDELNKKIILFENSKNNLDNFINIKLFSSTEERINAFFWIIILLIIFELFILKIIFKINLKKLFKQ